MLTFFILFPVYVLLPGSCLWQNAHALQLTTPADQCVQEITLEFHACGAVRDALAERGACLRRGQYDDGHTG